MRRARVASLSNSCLTQNVAARRCSHYGRGTIWNTPGARGVATKRESFALRLRIGEDRTVSNEAAT
jgi:hypothetical protein